MASETLDRLHHAATWRSHDRSDGWYERLQARWSAYHEYADEITARLPFKWHPVHMDNPGMNHTGYTNGADHIVLDEDFARGRLHRKKGQALCGGETVNLWNPSEHVSCKACLERAERIIGIAQAAKETNA